MKTFFFLLAAILSAASLEAAPISLRERRLSAKSKYKIEKQLVSAPSVDKVLSDKIDRSDSRTIRAPKATVPSARAKEKVLTPAPKGKLRKNTHVREWP